jgi:predicted cupin superfamily sugar epimerase
MTAQQLIDILRLQPHPEGGFYSETFRSSLAVESAEHPAQRSASTAIYFLLRSQDFSAFHRVRSDELWHHYAGDVLELHLIDAAGELRVERLGSDIAAGERPQALAPRNVLQAASVGGGRYGFALCGCTVAPGFDFADFDMPTRAALSLAHPLHAALFRRLCRDD